jgi:hypothetical protein
MYSFTLLHVCVTVVDGTDVAAQDREKWWTLVTVAMNIWVP